MDDVHGPPDVINGIPLNVATPLSSVKRCGVIFSSCFFFGFSTSSGFPSIPEKEMRSPTFAPSGGIKGSTTVGPSFEAHKTRPSDTTSRSFPGLTLVISTTRRFVNSSGLKYFAKPLTTCRNLASPTSISSTSKLSADGCFHALQINPT
ncbi:hypothetical protein V8G54_006229 [Vigna mungo]|uniref:Uncharacterized protein n=1 Tax=Vigna mungo TaxID=3915 RepID=A0AAQ3P1T8_VIGMU